MNETHDDVIASIINTLEALLESLKFANERIDRLVDRVKRLEEEK